MFLRVDVPATSRKAEYTKLIGTGSVYAITPVEEAAAKVAAEHLDEAPVSPYLLRALPAEIEVSPVMWEPDDGDDDDDDGPFGTWHLEENDGDDGWPVSSGSEEEDF